MTTTSILIISVIVLLIVIIFSTYNTLVRKKNQITNAFSSIDVMFKKRFDLIPNLIASVQQYMKHESETFAHITEMRSKNYSSMSDSEKIQCDKEFSQCKNSFLAVAENYPDLKSSDNFIQLQCAINETEEQLSAARRTYNASVVDYDNSLESIPTMWLAPMMGFSKNQFVLVTAEKEKENVYVKSLFNN